MKRNVQFSIIVCLGLACAAGNLASAVTPRTLYSFNRIEGSHPQGGLVLGSDGNFYGTASEGGPYQAGTVFRITPSGSLTTLYWFGGPHQGASPLAGLVQGSDGNFYGTTSPYVIGDGTVFRISPSGDFTNLYTFTGQVQSKPSGRLVQGSDGNFYGTTHQGGIFNWGTVFRISPSGDFTNLYIFSSSDGVHPYDGLAQGNDGNFYGTAYRTGSWETEGSGTVFRISSNGSLTTLYSTGATMTGGLTRGNDGNFYGITVLDRAGNSNTLFRISPSGDFTNLYSFNYGDHPYGGLMLGRDGYLYGTIYPSGADGQVYRINSSGSFTNLSPSDGSDRVASVAGVMVEGSDGNLYGTTSFGGVNILCYPEAVGNYNSTFGTVFKLVISNAPCGVIDCPVTSLAFGNVAVGQTATQNLTIANSGNSSLAIGAIVGTCGFYDSVWSGSIPAGGSTNVSIIFTPYETTNYYGSITVNSDACNGTNTINVTGTGISAATVATPIITPAGGTFNNSVAVTITCDTGGSTLRYTTTGADPIVSSPVYSGPFAVTSSGIVKVKAFKTGLSDSAVASATFTIINTTVTVATPAVTPSDGTFTNSVKVTLSTATAGATIRYTLNGTDPTSSSTVYKKIGITITNSVIFKAKAFKGSVASDIATMSFTIIVPPPPAIATTSLSDAPFKQPYTAAIQLAPGTGWGPFKWTLAPKSKLPTGLKLNAKTGVISGKATKTGTVTFMVVVTDARKKTGTQGLSLTVDASP